MSETTVTGWRLAVASRKDQAAENAEQRARELRRQADEYRRGHAAAIETRSAPKPTKTIAKRAN